MSSNDTVHSAMPIRFTQLPVVDYVSKRGETTSEISVIEKYLALSSSVSESVSPRLYAWKDICSIVHFHWDCAVCLVLLTQCLGNQEGLFLSHLSAWFSDSAMWYSGIRSWDKLSGPHLNQPVSLWHKSSGFVLASADSVYTYDNLDLMDEFLSVVL